MIAPQSVPSPSPAEQRTDPGTDCGAPELSAKRAGSQAEFPHPLSVAFLHLASAGLGAIVPGTPTHPRRTPDETHDRTLDPDDLSETDPVADLMGSADDAFAELASELEQFQDDSDDNAGGVLPAGFALFDAKPEAVAKLRDGGRDPHVTAVRVIPIHNGKKGHQCAKYAPEGLTMSRLRQALPPGTYDLQAVNQDGLWVGGKRVRVTNGEGLDSLPGMNGNGGGNAGSMGDKLLYALAMRGMGGGDHSSEMEKANAGMIKTMSSMMQMQMMDLKMRMELADRTDNKANSRETNSLEMVKTIMGMVQPKKSNGGGGFGKFEDFFAAMQFGMKLAGNGGAPEESDADKLKDWLLPLADSLAPGLISVLAMMLPPEQRQMASDLLEAHFKMREAEAKAAAPTSEDPPTVDTTGVPVGGGD